MINGASFPPEAQKLAQLEARLSEDLSLEDIEEIEQQIVVQTTDKTRGIAFNLLNRFEAKKPALVDRQITMISQAAEIDEKIKLLSPLIGYLDPEVVNELLAQFEVEVTLTEDPKVQAAAQRQLDHLNFAKEKPILHDLNQFIEQAKKIASAVLQNESLSFMDQFNNVQLAGIRQVAAIGA